MRAKKSDQRPRVLLVNGMGDWAGVLRLPWILRRSGAWVTALTPRSSRLARSWHLDEVVDVPQESAAFVDAVFQYVERHGDCFQLILVGNEPSLLALMKDKRIESSGHWFCVDP